MRYFVKVNGEVHCPDGIARPNEAADWEGGTLLLEQSVRFRDDIAVGDEVWIWTHEDEKFGFGRGLTASAWIDAVGEFEDYRALTLRKVDLFSRPAGFRNGFVVPTGSDLLDQIERNRHHETYLLPDEERDRILTLVRAWEAEQAARVAAVADAFTTPLARIIAERKTELVAAFRDRVVSTRKPRPGQQAFRQALLEAYEGRCVVTGCDVAAALEAAHIVPHTGQPELDTLENGLLLRRDLHSLFDALLWTIDPAALRIVLAPTLQQSSYRAFKDKQTVLRAGVETIRFHHAQFSKERKSSC